MKITKELENRFLILYSVLQQNGKATKKAVLNLLEKENKILLTEVDKTILKSRKEEKWRNELAFVRQHLVKEGFLNKNERNYWEITEQGKKYYNKIKENVLSGTNLERVNINQLYTESIQELENNYAKELFEDNLELKNEKVERRILAIKRYKSIVDKIKEKYNSKCQIESCQFSFLQKDGKFYSEGHHLKPISQGGNQNESNVVILCANHHRMFHFAKIKLSDKVGNERVVVINDEKLLIKYK